MDVVTQLRQPGNPPVLVVKGDEEVVTDELPAAVADAAVESSAELLIIPAADHYYRIRTGPPGTGVAFHDPDTTDRLLTAIERWIAATAAD
jgi:hypothetical protein